MVPSASKLFAGIDNPRVVGRSTHSLTDILLAALCATLCGFGYCDGYAQFARAKVNFLRRYLPYKAQSPHRPKNGQLAGQAANASRNSVAMELPWATM